jgi:hypothetical protein
MLVVIDQTWLTVSDERGRRRIDDPADFVHIEVATALKNDVIVMPVLVGSGTMPRAADLPGPLVALATKLAVTVRHESFRQDVELLADSIRAEIKRSEIQSVIDAAEEISQYTNRVMTHATDEESSLLLFIGSEESQNTHWSSHLLKDAIVQLITSADVGFWMKHSDEVQPDEFWAAILSAVADSYRADHPFPDGRTDAELIRELLEQLS